MILVVLQPEKLTGRLVNYFKPPVVGGEMTYKGDSEMLSKNKNTQNYTGNGSNGGAVARVLTREGISIPELRAVLKCRVIAPDDAGYDEARTGFYGGIDRRPAVIVRPAAATDGAQVVSLARETGLELAVRSGGHSSAGHSTSEGGILLDLRDMRELDIDVRGHTAWAETGLTAGEYTAAAGVYGLATGFGDTASVGIGGITLGGGLGYFVRKYGLTIDDLLAAEIVTADGQLLRVDAETHPDLFWAIRGGGGNFGVATRFQYRLHEVDKIVGGMLILPATPDVIAGFIAAAEAAPEELSTIANIMPAPPMPFVPAKHHGRLVVMAMLVYAGEVEAGERAVAPFRALAEPIADMVRPMRYPEIYPPEEGAYHPTAVARTMFVDGIDRDVAGTIVEYLQASDATMRAAQLRVLGGAMARVPVEATAFAHRQSRIMVNVAAFYDGPEDRAVREAWVEDFAAALHQRDSGAYVNFLGDEGGARVHEAYPGSTWDRLAAIKARYDPTNLFRLNQNIPPATEALASERQPDLASEGANRTDGAGARLEDAS
jgi:FAD/FMN-containing dehydrogenase